jgi:outer membrane biosynthesis protein TonB
MQKVPILAPKLATFVTKAVRDQSLKAMVGIPDNEDPAEKENKKLAEEGDEAAKDSLEAGPHQPTEAASAHSATAARKKRRLYRQTTDEEVPWFPHDNAIELLKELCWEAGKPRWVIHGTPAGGAGVQGCLEMDASVVALCFDEHHRDHFLTACVQRAVETMLAGKTSVFKDAELQARATALHEKPTKDKEKPPKDTEKPPKDKEQPKLDKEKEPEAVPPEATEKTPKKSTKPVKKKSAKAKLEASDAVSSEESDDEESEREEPTPKKKRTAKA